MLKLLQPVLKKELSTKIVNCFVIEFHLFKPYKEGAVSKGKQVSAELDDVLNGLQLRAP